MTSFTKDLIIAFAHACSAAHHSSKFHDYDDLIPVAVDLLIGLVYVASAFSKKNPAEESSEAP